MHCTNCGAQLPDGTVFCTNCGTQMAEEEAKTFCTNCGSTVSADAVSCPICGEALSTPNNTKKGFDLKGLDLKKLIVPAGIVVAAILVVILLVNLFSGTTYPQDALFNLLDNGNFTIKAEYSVAEVELQVDMNVKKREIIAYGELSAYGEKVEIGIYDEKAFAYSEALGIERCVDISDYTEDIFEIYESANKSKYADMVELICDAFDLDLDDIAGDVDLTEMEKGLKKLDKNLTNKKWLEENAGWSVKSKNGVDIHKYQPDCYKLATAALECLEKAFEDEDDYEDAMDSLKESKDELKDKEVELKVHVDGKYLVEIELNDYSVVIEDIGKTEIDIEELEDILKEVD